jgi:5'-nucleotidase/UDP-sugar diphosphatase
VNDRPIAPILATLAAVMFVAAFSAAAVLRPDSAPDPGAAARTAPATAQENASLATLVSPSLSRVAALPALHLPKARKPAKRKSKPETKPAPTAPRTPATPATPAATAAPPVRQPVTPAPSRPKSNVGKTFDSEG